MSEVLQVELREKCGKRNNRRLRKAGSIPAVLYGHGQPAVSLTVSADAAESAVRRGSRLVTLTGGVDDQAFIRELQWNTWGTAIVHLDFTRISADEVVRVRVVIEVRGEAPGVKDGGVVKQLVHDMEVDCPANAIPEKISLSVNELALDETITLGDIAIPEGVTPVLGEKQVIVQCALPVEALEEEVGGEAEPEVIGRKKTDEDEE